MGGNASGGEQGAADGQLPGCPCWDSGPTFFGVVRNIYLIFLLPADLSSYTPKHSVKFSEWQEQKYEGPAAEGSLPKEADSHGNQVMVRL